MSKVRVLDEEDVRRLLPMTDCIEAMDGALRSLARGEVYNPLRPVFRPPNQPSLMGLMPAHRGGEREQAVFVEEAGAQLLPRRDARPRQVGQVGIQSRR